MISKDCKIFVPVVGLSVQVVDFAGAYLFSVPLPVGVVQGRQLLQYQTPGHTLVFPDDVDIVCPPSRARRVRHDGHSDTAANPFFVPRPVSDLERMFEARLRRSEALHRRMIAELKAEHGHVAAAAALAEAKPKEDKPSDLIENGAEYQEPTADDAKSE